MHDDIAEAAIALFTALDDGAVIFEVLDEVDDLRVLAANPAVAGIAGAGTLQGRLGSELYPPSELADVVRRARAALTAGTPQSYEATRELPQGRRVLAATMIPVGRARVVSYGRDISARVEATRRLDELELLADIGSWQWNLADDVLQWSRHYRRLLGVADDEPPTMERVVEVIHPEDRARVTSRMAVTSAGRSEPEPITYRIVRPDGEERLVEGRGELVTAPDGAPIRMFGTIQDVTAAQRAEHDRQRLTRALEGQRQALELNDNVVQGLSAAWLAFDLGQIDDGIALVQRTTRDAQHLVSALLRDAAAEDPITPGSLARAAPANVDPPAPG